MAKRQGEDAAFDHLQTQPWLKGVRFRRKRYTAYSPDWDHDHCAACWVKFAEQGRSDAEEAVHEGYATCEDFPRGADYDWVCIPCFGKYANAMAWVEDAGL